MKMVTYPESLSRNRGEPWVFEKTKERRFLLFALFL